jgi:archaellum biogenesis protein FlaJ (TadC family)
VIREEVRDPAREDGKGQRQGDEQQEAGDDDEQSLNDMLQELRVLQQGVQVLTAFLIILPFSAGFDKVDQAEKWVYLITFVCSVASLVLYSAPAVQHRIMRPLKDRKQFKEVATRMVLMGTITMSVALVLVSQFVVSQAMGFTESLVVAGLVALLTGLIWWLMPLLRKGEER